MKGTITSLGNLFCWLTLLFAFTMLNAQNVAINNNGAPPDSSAILDVSADDRGVLIPRVDLIGSDDTLTVESPATGLLVYNTTDNDELTPGFYYWNSNTWQRISSPWMERNDTVFYYDGPVGIGVNNPQHMLEVIGNPGTEFTPVAYFESTLDTLPRG